MRASILIRTKNEEKHLPATLEAVFDQSVLPYEVLVIDSGSTDATLAEAQKFDVEILTLSPEGWSYPRALNFGARRARSEVFVCLSAHCRPATRDWLANLLRHFDDASVAAVWGNEIRPRTPLPPPEPARYQQPGIYGAEYRFWGLSNANSAIRRSVWESIPFDERLPGGEDKAWGRAALAHGYHVVYEPQAVVRHETHTLAAQYKRDRAALEGFRIQFPQLYGTPRGHITRALSNVRNLIASQARSPDLGQIWQIARAIPASLANVLRPRT